MIVITFEPFFWKSHNLHDRLEPLLRWTYLDTTRVADIVRIYHDFEGRIGDVFAAAFDRHQMFAYLPGCEGNTGVACKLDEIRDENQRIVKQRNCCID